ncbi:MAG TPA: N-acetyl-gamma-glutamyl-phosphate reductase [Chthoniobacteraceae bacterium]|nr:N-acetyl-gamma-glutamyl-phosphate reductase [Chthoniobacteraceae bacterium]
MQLEKIAVVGASGYSGEELIRLLQNHAGVELACVTSRQHAGKALGAIFPKFKGRKYDALAFAPSEVATVAASGARIVFLALPHGLAAEFAGPLLDAGLRVIDLSADFRLKDTVVYKEFYGQDHPAPALLPKSVYGLPEIYRKEIAVAKLVASPGCYPTSIILPLAPLLKAGLIDPKSIVVSSMSGVSGAGRKVEADYLFVECNESVRPYGVPKHRHLSEIEQELGAAAGSAVTISFTPHLIPVNRGILTTIYATPAAGATPQAVADAITQAYRGEPFVRLGGGESYPDIKNVAYTNFIDIAWRHDPRTGRLILMSAIDNLIKGASGQAVQGMNLMCGLPETAGL